MEDEELFLIDEISESDQYVENLSKALEQVLPEGEFWIINHSYGTDPSGTLVVEEMPVTFDQSIIDILKNQ